MGKKVSVKGFFNAGFLLIFIAALVLINIIASLVYRQIDMTDDQRYTLSNGTKEFLKDTSKFSSRVSIKIYLEGNFTIENYKSIAHFNNQINAFCEINFFENYIK